MMLGQLQEAEGKEEKGRHHGAGEVGGGTAGLPFFFFWIKGSSFMFLLYFSFLIVKQGCDCSVKIEKILKPIKRKLRLSIPTLWEHYNLGVHHFYLFLEYSKNL